MEGKQTRGRQRIPIRLIESQDDLYATFSKRRVGLYKKASELSTLCGVDIGVIIFSPTDNPFSFFHPSMESVVNRYTNPNQPLSDHARIIESHTRSRIDDLNRRLDEILEQKDQLKEHLKQLEEIDKTRQKGWWETPIESLNKEQVKEWTEWFQSFKTLIESRIEELKNVGTSSSVLFQSQNAPDLPSTAGPSTGVGPSNLVPRGPSYYGPGMEMMGAEQFPGHDHRGAPPQAQDSLTSHIPGQFFLPPPPLNAFGGGGSDQYFHHPPPQNPSAGGASFTDPFPAQYSYIQREGQDPSAGGGSRGAGPSH